MSIFITALPLLYLAVTTTLKVELMVEDLGFGIGAAEMTPLILWVVGIVLVCLGLALAMSILTASEVSRSAAKLVTAMRKVEEGDLHNHLEITGTDEYADLFRGFNLMTSGLREEVRILEVTHDLSGELNLDALLERIMGATTELLDADRSTVFVHAAETNELWSRFAEGMETTEIRFDAGEGIAGQVFTDGEVQNVNDPYSHPPVQPQDRSSHRLQDREHPVYADLRQGGPAHRCDAGPQQARRRLLGQRRISAPRVHRSGRRLARKRATLR